MYECYGVCINVMVIVMKEELFIFVWYEFDRMAAFR